jgi:alpha-beta hydrolase superfamily lysophospholipase
MPHPVVFEGCTGWYYPGTTGLGVVMCGPHGYEDLCVFRHWRHLAETLAQRGLPTLRFDYPGTGDSSGDESLPASVAAWVLCIRQAMQLLRDLAGVEKIALVGLRMGALLASLAAEQGDVAALALLAPISSGEACYRELRALALMAVETRHRATASVGPAGRLEAAGFVYTAETLADLRAVTLAPAGVVLADTVLVLNRPGAAVDASFSARLATSGAAVQEEIFQDYTSLLRDADFSAYPAQGFGRVVDWLGALAIPAASEAKLPASPASLALPSAEEAPVFVSRAPDMFGVYCAPLRAPFGPALLFLNTGANRHIGTSRMTVTMARRLADLGFASLRLDVAGVGESDPVPGRTHHHPSNSESVVDVCQAMDWLQGRGFQEFILIGLCSGGKLALETTLADQRVVGQVLLNLQGFWKRSDPRDQYASRRTYMRLVRNPANWKLVLKGDANLPGIVKSIFRRSISAIVTELREPFCLLLGRPSQRYDGVAAFRALAARGVRSQFIYVDEDPGMDELEPVFGRNGRRLAQVPNVSMHFLTEGNHVFSWEFSRIKLYATVEQALARMVASGAPARLAAMPLPRAEPTLQDTVLG